MSTKREQGGRIRVRDVETGDVTYGKSYGEHSYNGLPLPPVSQDVPRLKIGEIVATKPGKTIGVQVARRLPHPRIVEVVPASKLKNWKLAEVVKRAVQASVEKH